MGYLLNTTFVLHTSVEAGFITWVREVYLPAAAEAGVFGVSRVAKVLTQVEPDTVSIAVQLEATSIERSQPVA